MKKVLLLIAFLIVSCKNDEINKPNILFIMSDDHTSQSWGIYGGILKDYVKNDGIKRLAKSGVVLENLFCTNAICVPSRASILTGQYSHVNGVYNLPDALDPDSLNVAKILKNNGYQTSIVGKWHLKKEPSGFDYYKVLPGQGLYNDPYFKTKENCFKPLINFITRKQIKKISLYYPSNYEFDTLKLFQILKKRDRTKTLLPIILKNNSMKFVSWKYSDPLMVNKFGGKIPYE